MSAIGLCLASFAFGVLVAYMFFAQAVHEAQAKLSELERELRRVDWREDGRAD
jgi:hypothetical protein